MSQGGGGDVGQGSFNWEAQTWIFSNSDNSGGSEHKSRMKLLESRSNSPTDPIRKNRRRNTRAGAKGSSSKGKDGGESDHETTHIFTERERRKKMRNMFSNLHALLPNFPAKTDKSTIIDEAVGYINTLEQTVEKLEKQKSERNQGASTNSFDDLSSTIAFQQAQGTIIDDDNNNNNNTREAFLAEQGNNSWGAMPMNSTSTPMSIPRVSSSTNGFNSWISPNVVLSVSGEDAHINVCTSKKVGQLSNILSVMEKYKLEVLSTHVSSDYFRSMYMIHAKANGDQFSECLIEEIFKLAANEVVLLLSL